MMARPTWIKSGVAVVAGPSAKRWIGSDGGATRTMDRRTQNIFDGLIVGDRASLARSITLIESTAHVPQAGDLVSAATRQARSAGLQTFRIGLSGPPGAGKSTFIESFGRMLTSAGSKVAVLAVDPSSTVAKGGGGSLLGDKTRMPELSRDPKAFIRPSPSRGHLGGVTRTTNEAIVLCEVAGFDVIIVETVGVGQSEVAVAEMVDAFCLLLPPGSGDDLQGIKRGIVEMVDFVLVNKSDGDLLPAARRTAADYSSALRFIRPKWSGWRPSVALVSAKTGEGLEKAWEDMQRFKAKSAEEGEFEARRGAQRRKWMWNYINHRLISMFENNEAVKQAWPSIEDQVINLEISPGSASDTLINAFLSDPS